MRLKKFLCSPWPLLLIAVGALLLMADLGLYRQEGVSMNALEDTVSSKGVTVEVLNATERRLWNRGYGQDHRLQRRLLGLWLPVRQTKRPAGEVCAALPAYFYEKNVPPNGLLLNGA